jgi:hypothetical protein
VVAAIKIVILINYQEISIFNLNIS